MNSIVPFIKTHPFFGNYPLWDINFFKNESLKFGNVSVPPVNILESIRHYTLEMAVPGYDKKDFTIEIDDKGILSIEMNAKNEKVAVGNAEIKQLEYNYSTFTRCFSVHSSIDTQHITAAYSDGILTIYMPKLEMVAQAQAKVVKVN